MFRAMEGCTAWEVEVSVGSGGGSRTVTALRGAAVSVRAHGVLAPVDPRLTALGLCLVADAADTTPKQLGKSDIRRGEHSQQMMSI